MTLLKLEKVTKIYPNHVRALDCVSLDLKSGQSMGIVGESGSGKSSLTRIIVGLETYDDGRINFNYQNIPLKKKKDRRQFHRDVQLIFQDPTSSLNPKLPIWKSILEPLSNYKEIESSLLKTDGLSKKAVAAQLLELVGLESLLVDRYPYELSGGQKQRVSIARAISLEPRLLICDEPTASLDVSVQVQVLDLLKELQKKTKMAILFISHDIRAVTYLCEKVAVLKDGACIDQFSLDDLYEANRHAYTKQLIEMAKLD